MRHVAAAAGVLMAFMALGCALGGPGPAPAETPTPAPSAPPGARWEVIASPAIKMEALDFVNAQDAWAVGDSNDVLRSSDGGLTWAAPQALPSSFNPNVSYFESVSFVDPRFGFLGGSYGVFKTTDGGASWARVQPFDHANGPPPVDQRAFVRFRDYEHGVVVWQGQLHRTTDGGATWTASPLGAGTFRRLGMVGSEFAVLTDAKLWVSKPDAGWGEIPLPTGFDEGRHNPAYADFCFLDAQNGWVSGNKRLSRTTDGGVTWTPLAGVGEVERLFFLDAARGWILNRREWKATRTGGATWVDVPYQAYGGDSRNVPWGIEAANPDHVFVFTGTGVLRRWIAP